MSLNIYWTEALQILFQYFSINPFPIIKTHFYRYLLLKMISIVTFINIIFYLHTFCFIPTNRTLNMNYIKGINQFTPIGQLLRMPMTASFYAFLSSPDHMSHSRMHATYSMLPSTHTERHICSCLYVYITFLGKALESIWEATFRILSLP